MCFRDTFEMFYVHPGTQNVAGGPGMFCSLSCFFANVKNITKTFPKHLGIVLERGAKGEGIWAPWKGNANDCRKSLLLLLGSGSLGNNLSMLLFCVRPK